MTKVVPNRSTRLDNYLRKFSRANGKGYVGDDVSEDLRNAYEFIKKEFGDDYDDYDDYSDFRYSNYDVEDVPRNKKNDGVSYSNQYREHELSVLPDKDKSRSFRNGSERDNKDAERVRFQTEEGRYFRPNSETEEDERRGERLKRTDE